MLAVALLLAWVPAVGLLFSYVPAMGLLFPWMPVMGRGPNTDLFHKIAEARSAKTLYVIIWLGRGASTDLLYKIAEARSAKTLYVIIWLGRGPRTDLLTKSVTSFNRCLQNHDYTTSGANKQQRIDSFIVKKNNKR